MDQIRKEALKCGIKFTYCTKQFYVFERPESVRLGHLWNVGKALSFVLENGTKEEYEA